jgi:hypothetical protein
LGPLRAVLCWQICRCDGGPARDMGIPVPSHVSPAHNCDSDERFCAILTFDIKAPAIGENTPQTTHMTNKCVRAEPKLANSLHVTMELGVQAWRLYGH